MPPPKTVKPKSVDTSEDNVAHSAPAGHAKLVVKVNGPAQELVPAPPQSACT